MLNPTKARPVGSTAMVASALRNAIGSGAIPPGAPLKQDDIAEEFSVSHTPVREALKMLVSEGLATLYHNRGCFVSDLSSAVARELTEFRAALEPKLACWALDNLRRRDIDQAKLIMKKIDSAADPMERLRLATDFHTVIYDRAGRPFFLEQINRARTNLNRYWRLAWTENAFPEKTQDEHQRILDLCIAGDRAGLIVFVEQHIVNSGMIVLRYLETLESSEDSPR